MKNSYSFKLLTRRGLILSSALLNLIVKLFIFIFSALITLYLCGKYKHSGESLHLKGGKNIQRTNVSLEVACREPLTDN